jgi:hypothetical protein
MDRPVTEAMCIEIRRAVQLIQISRVNRGLPERMRELTRPANGMDYQKGQMPHSVQTGPQSELTLMAPQCSDQ